MDYYATYDKRTGEAYAVDLSGRDTPTTLDADTDAPAVEPLGYSV